MTRLLSVLIFLTVFTGLVVHGGTSSVGRIENPDARIPRVALLVDEPNLEALLLVGFSGVETLGRAELPTLAAERLLTGGSLGLTNAEVALIVERSGDRGVVKVVQCESGATVVVLELPKMPVGETARWIVARTQPLLGAVADPMRPRISLPGLRFVTDSAENRVTERAINLMLTARLQARGAVVLERWRMGDLVFEKSLATQESPFWKAAEIVDGSVSADGGRLSARVRIRGAAGAETFAEAAGETAGDMVDAIVIQVMAGSWKTDVGAKNETEAAAFLTEAKWMLEHGLPREAWQATESALALGVTSRREAEMLRVKAAAMCAYPDDLKNSGYGQDGGYRVRAFKTGDLGTRVAAATEAVLLAGDYWKAYPLKKAPQRWVIEYPDSLGIRTLYTGLRVLRGAYELGWAEANTDAVRGLRAAIRRNVALMEGGHLGNQRTTFLIYLANYAGYWSESPAEAVDFYRRVLTPDFDAGLKTWPEAVRGELAVGDAPHPPFLIGTAPKEDFPFGVGSTRVMAGDEATARSVWEAFLNELAHSSHALNRADSLALRWQSTADKSARIALAVQMTDFMSENVEALAGPQGYAIFCQFTEPLRHATRSTDFAEAGGKLIDAFVALINAESTVSPKILGYTWALFERGNVIQESQGREVLAALDARRTRHALSPAELSGIDAACSSVWKRFPSLRPAESAVNTLMVQSLWIAAEHLNGKLRGHIGFSPDAAVWQDGLLWVLDPHRGRLWEIEPRSGDAVVHLPENSPEADYESQLIPWGTRFVITAQRGVWVLDEKKRIWNKLDLPSARYRIASAHGDLWAASGERVLAGNVKQTEGNALYRISPELTVDLVASSRRRPPVHPLDAVLTGAPFVLSQSKDDGVIVGAWGEKWTFLDSASAVPPKRLNQKFVGNVEMSSSPGLAIRSSQEAGDRRRLVRIEFIDDAIGGLLLAHPKRDPAGKARFAYPQELEDLSSSHYVAAWRNEGLDVLAWSTRGSPWGASEAWLLRIDADGCVARSLRFAWNADLDKRTRAASHSHEAFRYPSPDARGLIVTDHGLVITGRAMSGFWFIPNEDLDGRRKVERAGPRN